MGPMMYVPLLYLGSIFLCICINGCLANRLKELDEILQNYDKRVRPFRNVSPVQVKIQVFLSALGPINTKTFTFEVSIYLREWWRDPRIKFENESITLNGDPNFLWLPDLFIPNSHGTDMHKVLTDTVSTQISSDGYIFVSAGLKATSSCNMNLKMYPMDSQTCSIFFESYAFNNKKLNLIWLEKPLEYDVKSTTVSGFTVKSISTDYYNKTYSTGEVFSGLEVSFHMDRTFSFYLYRSYVPSIFLVVLSWGTFQIPVSAYPARVTLIVSSFLASTFILQHASSEYTKVEYTTAIEIFLLVNISFIMITMIEYMLVVRSQPKTKQLWNKQCSSSEAKKTKSLKHIGNSASWDVTKDEGKEHPDSDHARNADVRQRVKYSNEIHTVPDLHVIDRISRVLIPIVYIIFSVAYFAYFLA